MKLSEKLSEALTVSGLLVCTTFSRGEGRGACLRSSPAKLINTRLANKSDCKGCGNCKYGKERQSELGPRFELSVINNTGSVFIDGTDDSVKPLNIARGSDGSRV